MIRETEVLYNKHESMNRSLNFFRSLGLFHQKYRAEFYQNIFAYLAVKLVLFVVDWAVGVITAVVCIPKMQRNV